MLPASRRVRHIAGTYLARIRTPGPKETGCGPVQKEQGSHSCTSAGDGAGDGGAREHGFPQTHVKLQVSYGLALSSQLFIFKPFNFSHWACLVKGGSEEVRN